MYVVFFLIIYDDALKLNLKTINVHKTHKKKTVFLFLKIMSFKIHVNNLGVENVFNSLML